MILFAHAKINLLLRAPRKRSDGYHDLFTLMQTVSLADRVQIERTKEDGIRCSTDDPSLSTDEGNLAVRAAGVFFRRTGHRPAIRIRLHKRIPARAGLGGGSSDAAATLVGLNRLHGEPLSPSELREDALAVGSDVPFLLRGGCAVAEGRGERLSWRHSLSSLHALLVRPDFGIDTPWAYRQLTPTGDVSPVLRSALACDPLDLRALIPHITNDLEPGVAREYPAIRRIEEHLMALGAFAARMTGSGSAVFGLFADPESVETARRRWRETDDAALLACETIGIRSAPEGVTVEPADEAEDGNETRPFRPIEEKRD